MSTAIVSAEINPEVSVILPAYNCGRFLKEAVESVLHQTFSNFELIILNDGSTDDTETIIHLIKDKRIVYVKNDENKGLVYTLNRGIDLARGGYIARMDGDDICLPERFENQKTYLDQNKNTAAVASTIVFINENGTKTGEWKIDQHTISNDQIRKIMPYENCIAHPSVMIRSEILKVFQYKPCQKNIEDYDLWLRMLNRGLYISKIDKPLLLYRIHQTSVTGSFLKNKNFFYKHAGMKWKFLINELRAGKITYFAIKVSMALLLDIIKGTAKSIKSILVK